MRLWRIHTTFLALVLGFFGGIAFVDFLDSEGRL
jgi:hypothetical protein